MNLSICTGSAWLDSPIPQNCIRRDGKLMPTIKAISLYSILWHPFRADAKRFCLMKAAYRVKVIDQVRKLMLLHSIGSSIISLSGTRSSIPANFVSTWIQKHEQKFEKWIKTFKSNVFCDAQGASVYFANINSHVASERNWRGPVYWFVIGGSHHRLKSPPCTNG